MSEERNERRKKKWIIENTSELHFQHTWYHYKNLDEIILTIS